jgi:KDO2-lipid IV(A) lauroyltransferase
LAERVADLWYAGSPRLRSALDRNLALVPRLAASPGARRAVAQKSVRNFARVVTEFLCLARMDSADLERLVEMDPFRDLARSLESRPAVLVTAHLGNWELGAAALAAAGIKLQVVVYDHPDLRVAALFREIRRARGLEMLSVAAAASRLGEMVSRVNVGIAGDRDFTGRGTKAAFFGAATRVPSAYASLALQSGTPVIVGFCLRGDDGRYHLVTGPRPAAEGLGASDGPAMIREYLALLEKSVDKHPEQWYRFDDVTV